jgi:Protein of unknown function (DUF3365)
MKSLVQNQWFRIFVLIFLWPCLFNVHTVYGKDRKQLPGIPPDVVASYIHSIIEADRTIYSTYIVNRLHEKKVLKADEAWEQKNVLPLPAQFLQQSGRLVAEMATGIRFRLISLWPIYERNGPATDFERKGLEVLAKHPGQPYSGVVQSGKVSYYQAIFADKAVTKSCVDCHNTHPLSPKRNFKLNDVMGAIVITIPFPE